MDIKWNYTNKIVNDLIKINKVKEIVDLLKLPISIEDEIKREIIVKQVHYSTKIEGNTLNLKEVEKVIEKDISSHERNVLEVRNYYNALMYLNKIAECNDNISKDLILKVHNLVEGKKITFKNSFRTGQNVVKDSISGTIIYLPPEARDVEILIKMMIERFNEFEKDVPLPIKAGILAYEFVTIHPFWDGNGRTARLLATYILKAYGYDLKGFYVMEEFYDKNILEYYNSLQMNLHHNYYFGRNTADITKWLEYFLDIMANTFEIVGNRIEDIYTNSESEIDSLDMLDKRERWIASYLLNNNKIKARDIANHFKVNLDTANNWIKKWLEKEFLIRFNTEQIRNVDYVLSSKYQEKLK